MKTRYSGFKTFVEVCDHAYKNKSKAFKSYGYDKKNKHFYEVEE